MPNPWDNKPLQEFIDPVTGEKFISWPDSYGKPNNIKRYWNKEAGQWQFKQPLEQKLLIFTALYEWKVDGFNPHECLARAKSKFKLLPGQWPLPNKSMNAWEAIRVRHAKKGISWPLSREEYDSFGLPEDMWERYNSITPAPQRPPPLGIRYRVMKMAQRDGGLRLYLRDMSIYEGGALPAGTYGRTIRQNVWSVVVTAAVAYLKAGTEIARDQRRHQLRGAALAYASFVDPYSLSYEEFRGPCIKFIEQQAIQRAKESQ